MQDMREIPKKILATVQSAPPEQSLRKELKWKTLAPKNHLTRSGKPIEIGLTRPQRKCFLYHNDKCVAREYRSTTAKTEKLLKWLQKILIQIWVKYSVGGKIRYDIIKWSVLIIIKIKKAGNVNYSNHVQANRESQIDAHNTEIMPILKI